MLVWCAVPELDPVDEVGLQQDRDEHLSQRGCGAAKRSRLVEEGPVARELGGRRRASQRAVELLGDGRVSLRIARRITPERISWKAPCDAGIWRGIHRSRLSAKTMSLSPPSLRAISSWRSAIQRALPSMTSRSPPSSASRS